jgi:hypothetical protein
MMLSKPPAIIMPIIDLYRSRKSKMSFENKAKNDILLVNKRLSRFLLASLFLEAFVKASVHRSMNLAKKPTQHSKLYVSRRDSADLRPDIGTNF